ncbi:MAG: ABC transporter permease [Bacteroidales bacterium]|nr:ABC transporter permease [Bacteroidales bacterium]
MIDLIQEILVSLRRNKLRTALTGFAVAWGIFMLIVLLGSGNGVMNAMRKQIEGIPLNIMEVYPGWTTMPYKGWKENREVKFTLNSVEETRKMTENVDEIFPVNSVSGIILAYGNEHTSESLNGVIEKYDQMNSYIIEYGRFINDNDLRMKRKCIVLSDKTADILFGKDKSHAIGKYVKANQVMYQVVGIYTTRNNSMMSPPSFIPYTTLQLIYQKDNSVESISFLTKNITTKADENNFEERYRTTMAKSLEFDPKDQGAIWMWSMFDNYLQMMQGESVLNIAIWVIGIFTLLSGIVGVSNIMLITVKERTREFGIRKAIGAKPRNILSLIIAESITVTTLFGYIGLVAGVAYTEYMNVTVGSKVLDIGVEQATVFENPTVDLAIAIQATLTLIIAGTLAGFIPARKAAHIPPIEALRAE